MLTNRIQITTPVQIIGAVFLGLALALFLAAALAWPQDQERGGTTPTSDPSATANGLIQFYEGRIKNDPWDFMSHNKLADAYLQRARLSGDITDYRRAETALGASLEIFPSDNYSAVAQLASVYVYQHRFNQGLDLAQRAIALDPGDAFGYAVLGDAQLELGRYQEANATYEQLLRMVQGPSSYSRLARIADIYGGAQGAEIQWLNGLSSDNGRQPERKAWTQTQLGHLYFNLGRLSDAERQYKRSLSTYQGYVHGLAGLATVKAAQGDFQEAVALYEQVVARYPSLEYVIAFGDLHLVSGNAGEAARQFELVNVINLLYQANGVNTDLGMARFFADHDVRLEEALRMASAAYEERPSIEAADILSWALYKLGHYQEAARYSEEALSLGSQDALMLFHAGMIQEKLGRTDMARLRLGQALF